MPAIQCGKPSLISGREVVHLVGRICYQELLGEWNVDTRASQPDLSSNIFDLILKLHSKSSKTLLESLWRYTDNVKGTVLPD